MDLVLLDFLPLMFAFLIIVTVMLALKGRPLPYRLFALPSAVSLFTSSTGMKPRTSVAVFAALTIVCASVILIRIITTKTKS